MVFLHAPDWLICAQSDVIWRHRTLSSVSANQIARKLPDLWRELKSGVMSCFFPVLKCHFFALEWAFDLLFFLKMCKKFSRFRISYREVAATSSSMFFWRFFDFLLAQKQFFPFNCFSCSLFKFAVNGPSSALYSEIQSEKIISNEPFSDEILAIAMKKC